MRSLLLVAVLACAVYALAEGKPEEEKGDNSALTEIDNAKDFALANNDKISSSALEAGQEKLVSELVSILGRHRRRRQQLRGGKCKCEGNECSCCLKIRSFETCIRVAHDGKNFDVGLTAKGSKIFNIIVPFDDSNSLCGYVGGIVSIEICAEIYDASIANGKARACLRFSKPIQVNVLCFDMGSSIHPITQEVTHYITEDTDSGYHDDHDGNDEDGNGRLMEFEALE